MRLLSFFVVLGLSSFTFASETFQGDHYSVSEVAKIVLDKTCPSGAGDYIDEHEVDGDYDYSTYAVEFENGVASVTVTRERGETDDARDTETYEVYDVDCTPVSKERISPETAILIARAYAVGLPESVTRYVETSIDEELSNVWYEDHSGYNFVMYDKAGDCGLVITVGYDGAINQSKTYRDWSCQ